MRRRTGRAVQHPVGFARDNGRCRRSSAIAAAADPAWRHVGCASRPFMRTNSAVPSTETSTDSESIAAPQIGNEHPACAQRSAHSHGRHGGVLLVTSHGPALGRTCGMLRQPHASTIFQARNGSSATARRPRPHAASPIRTGPVRRGRTIRARARRAVRGCRRGAGMRAIRRPRRIPRSPPRASPRCARPARARHRNRG